MITILGTGQVGKAILDELIQLQIKTKILLVNQHGKVNFELPKDIDILATDVTKPESLVEIFQKSEIVFSCTDVPYQLWSVFYPALSVAMINGLKASSAKLVFADNMYSYGNHKGQVMHEEMNHNAETRKGKIRAELIRNFERYDVSERVAIVKSSDFIGPNITKGLFGLDFLTNIYKNKTVYLPIDAHLPHHFTYIKDFAKAMVMVAFDTSGYNQLWHVPNCKAISQNDWINLFGKEAGKKIKYRVIPKFVINFVGIFNSSVCELTELSYQFEYEYLVNAQKFIEHYKDISTSPNEIVEQTINWFKKTR